MGITDTILGKMSNVFKPQRKFILALFAAMIVMRGKVNFRNLSRYSELCEKTFSRQYRTPFDFAKFNKLGIEMVVPSGTTMAAAIDCSFIRKSGNKTYGLDIFYNSIHAKPEKGLEISGLAVVDVDYNTAYSVSTWQTPAKMSAGHTRIDWYLEQFVQDCPCLPSCVRYILTDGYYTKKKFVDGVCNEDYHMISKLRCDSNLRYLYTGAQKLRGRPKLYDGKVRLNNLSRFEFAGEKDNLSLYTAVVNSPSLKRNIRVVCVVSTAKHKIGKALLMSTDIDLSAEDIYRFYKSRFQIEFLFRDAKQFAGLSDCQACSEISLDFHFNACMTALNLMKWEYRKTAGTSFNNGCSIASIKIRKFNEYLLKQFSAISGIDLSSIKSSDAYHHIINIGTIAP